MTYTEFAANVMRLCVRKLYDDPIQADHRYSSQYAPYASQLENRPVSGLKDCFLRKLHHV